MGQILTANCSICGNSSGYDEISLKQSTYRINGIKTILCCPCEDDLKIKLVHNFDTDTLRAVCEKFQISFDHLQEIIEGLSQEEHKLRHGDESEL